MEMVKIQHRILKDLKMLSPVYYLLYGYCKVISIEDGRKIEDE